MSNEEAKTKPDGGASVSTDGLGGEEPAWQVMERQREAFEFFAAVIFGMDITRLGAMYLDNATLAAWEAWQEAEENETMPALGPERETLNELARLSIENLMLKQTTPNAALRPRAEGESSLEGTVMQRLFRRTKCTN